MRDPAAWARVASLVDHIQERANTVEWEVIAILIIIIIVVVIIIIIVTLDELVLKLDVIPLQTQVNRPQGGGQHAQCEGCAKVFAQK